MQKAARRQPSRDRHPLLPRRHRARAAHGRGLQLRGPLLAAPLQGGRGVPDRPAERRRAGALVPEHRRASSRSPSSTASTRSTPATAFSPRTRRSRAPARKPASRSSARPPEQLEMFGDKTAAKRLAQKAGVPTIPGTEHGARRRRRRDEAAAKRIGYPADHQGQLRRRRPRDARRAGRRRAAEQARRGPARGRRGVRPARGVPRALHPRAPSTSRCRSSATRTATSCTSGSATARSSGAIRRSSRSRRASTSPTTSRERICDAAVAAVPLGRATATPARSSSCSTWIAASSTSSR